MNPISPRPTIMEQVASTLRQSLASGTWTGTMPSERSLAQLLRVSRPTLRAALHMLGTEGLLNIRERHRNRITVRRKRPRPAPSRLIVIVTQELLPTMPITFYDSVNEMRTQLAEYGFNTEVFPLQSHNTKNQQRKLEELMRERKILCCVLISVRRSLQEWFAQRKIPVLVLGACHPSVSLPSLDVDYRTVCRHATNILLQKGHTSLALIIPQSDLAGDLVSEQGFLEAVAQHRKCREVYATVVRHNSTAKGLNARLEGLFNHAQKPTGLLVANEEHTFIVIMYLLKRGIAVPGEVSLISRDHDRLFSMVIPTISHYFEQQNVFTRQLIRLMLQLVRKGSLAPKAHLIFPQYFAGGTVKDRAGSYSL